MPFDPALGREPFAYVTTTGRRTGLPREIEIWFALSDDGGTVYLMAGGGERARWVRNLQADPAATVRIAGATRRGRAEVLGAGTEEDAAARDRVAGKYARPARPLERWRATALPVAIRV